MSNDLTKQEIDMIVNGLHSKLANDQIALLRELQEARKELSEANETIGTFNELRELLPAIKQFGISFNPQSIQKNINSCVRGECRRLHMNMADIRKKIQQVQASPQVPMVQQAPPQTPPSPQVFHCDACGAILPIGTEICSCGAVYNWN